MIRVERGAAPDFIFEPGFQEAQETYEQFQLEGGSRVSQRMMDFARALGPYLSQAAEYAHSVFRGKCAYTEVPVEPQLYLHRPEYDAFDQRLPSSPKHYWWTAAWYRNWYVASTDVQGYKRNAFPVIGKRATPPSAPVMVKGEVPSDYLDRGVLLDPCVDYPQLHLLFQDNGTVVAWGAQKAPWLRNDERQRGDETITLLDLNSPRLIESRRIALGPVLARLRAPEPSLTADLVDAGLPHVGAVRQVAASALLAARPTELTDSMLLVLPELVPLMLANQYTLDSTLVSQTLAALHESNPELAKELELFASLPMPDTVTPPRRRIRPVKRGLTARQTKVIPRTAAITRVRIWNFQAIEDLDLSVPIAAGTPTGNNPGQASSESIAVDPTSIGPTERPWRVLLGENGSGKSSTLRAIAVALASISLPTLHDQVALEWRDLIRRGTKEARVVVDFTHGKIDLRITEDGPRFYGGAPVMDCFVRGFGPTRLTTDTTDIAQNNVRLGNLFDPRHPVVDAQRWLLNLARTNVGDFNVAAVAIARLLGQEEQVVESGVDAPKYIECIGDEVLVDGEPMRTISDGYRAIISMTCDLMAGAGSGLSDIRNASGIVLVDELGSYLHPRWKMQITPTLRKVFPSMQFFVTTHEPLCLRGLGVNEVIRVRASARDARGSWHSEFETIEESPARLRVDQLLTSSLFGLETTIDPVVERQFAQYYELIRKPEPTTDDQLRAVDLRAELSQYGILGYTARDQLVYDAIDHYLASSTLLTPSERRVERAKTLEQVADIWRTVAIRRSGARP